MSSARFMARRSWTATKVARRSWRPVDSHNNSRLNLQSRNAFCLQQQVDSNANLDALLSPRALEDFKVDAASVYKASDADVGSPQVASVLAAMKTWGDHVDKQSSAKSDVPVSSCSEASILSSMNASLEHETARRATVGDHVLIKDTHRTRKRFTEGIGKVFVITNDDKAFLPYQCDGNSSWLREEDVKLWQAAPLLSGQGACSASPAGRPTIGDRVVIEDTPRTRKQCSEGIGQVCVIRTDDQAFLPYQCEGSSVWLREEDVKLHKV